MEDTATHLSNVRLSPLHENLFHTSVVSAPTDVQFFENQAAGLSFNRHKQPSITGIFAEWQMPQRSNNSINKRVIKRWFQRGAEAVVQKRKSAPSLQLAESVTCWDRSVPDSAVLHWKPAFILVVLTCVIFVFYLYSLESYTNYCAWVVFL